jgi:hypothetical protein
MRRLKSRDHSENTDKIQSHKGFQFEKGSIEHTCLDVELVCSKTNIFIGRPYPTLLIEEYSRSILAAYLSLSPPSYKTLEITIQKCIKKYSRHS